MDIETIYQARQLARNPLPDTIHEIISKLKISFRPFFRKPFQRRRFNEHAFREYASKVNDKKDPNYDKVSSAINKITKSNFALLIKEILEAMEKGSTDEVFHLRVTTLLFDRGIRQPFFAPLMADIYAEIIKTYPDTKEDLTSQVKLFDKLYDVSDVIAVPSSDGEELFKWTKQKDLKRGFATYISELYNRNLLSDETMNGFVTTVIDEIKGNIRLEKNTVVQEHVHALVEFLFVVSKKLTIKQQLTEILAIPRTDVPNLTMKTRFKLEDAAKASR